jgi:hypothetical protein
MRAKGLVRLKMALLCALGVVSAWDTSFAQSQTAIPPLRGEKVRSMGQPVYWKPYIGPSLVWDRRDQTRGGVQLYGGVYRDLLGHAVGAFGVAGEAYYRYVGEENDGGFRLTGIIPFIGIGLGTDYSFEAEDWDFMMSFQFPWRRGGPLGLGDALRIDYFPTRNHSFALGLSIPIFQPWVGKTRPKRDSVELVRRPRLYDSGYKPSAELRNTLDVLRETSGAVNRFTTPFLDIEGDKDEAHVDAFMERLETAKARINATDERFPDGHTFAAVIDVYHRELEKAFVLAAGVDEERGRKVACQARRILRDEVVFPYNRLLGERKKRDSLLGLGMRAEEVFGAWLFTSSGVPPARHPAILYVFDELIKMWDANRYAEKRKWGDSRLVWIPLHYVIRPDEADSQTELNAIIEAAVQQEFSDANDVYYVINELFTSRPWSTGSGSTNEPGRYPSS